MAEPRYTDGTIDVTQLGAPSALGVLNLAALVAERKALLPAAYAKFNVPFNAQRFESDPAMPLVESDAMREYLDKNRINSAVRAVLPAFSKGPDLDHIVAFANVKRIVLVPANAETGADAIMESDASLLRRYLLSFDAPAAGSEDAYLYHSLNAWLTTAGSEPQDVAALDYTSHGRDGAVEIVLLNQLGLDVPDSVLNAVAAAFRRNGAGKSSRPMTDNVSVRAATINRYSITGRLIIPRGPDPEIVRQAATASALAFGAARYRIGGEVPVNAVASSIYSVGNIVRVEDVTPVFDQPPADDVAPYLESVKLSYVVRG